MTFNLLRVDSISPIYIQYANIAPQRKRVHTHRNTLRATPSTVVLFMISKHLTGIGAWP